MKNKELLPCPFCGGEAALAYGVYDRWIFCKKCGASTKQYETNEEAIAAWNTRTNTIPVGNGEDYEVVQK